MFAKIDPIEQLPRPLILNPRSETIAVWPAPVEADAENVAAGSGIGLPTEASADTGFEQRTAIFRVTVANKGEPLVFDIPGGGSCYAPTVINAEPLRTVRIPKRDMEIVED